ncbi:hypothetical protein CLV63_1318 [Murinocardiopsis flavida]|uniref:Uncharacterized protein n=1 Tax=Murinocardiopsis flavida TaxID=645275 RepID=A0A2P8CR65_9ACTN|nr:hypothetical protein [Murinocardiopsis flavida]PSK87455.1 hypothetical protein CLV63_1318 [Murinocardiopsis flavida]
MTIRRTRIIAGLATGAAAAALSLMAAGPALAADWVVAGGGYKTEAACIEDGKDYIDDDYHDYTEFKCEKDTKDWTMYVR